jgi:hypothetical protein
VCLRVCLYVCMCVFFVYVGVYVGNQGMPGSANLDSHATVPNTNIAV